MKAAFAVSFEFATKAPETVRGLVEAGNPRTLARLAVRAAMDAHPGVNWTSLVVVLDRDEDAIRRAGTTDNQTSQPQPARTGTIHA